MKIQSENNKSEELCGVIVNTTSVYFKFYVLWKTKTLFFIKHTFTAGKNQDGTLQW